MLVLYLLGWMLLGIVVIFTTVFIHVLMAEKRGYRALEWLRCASKKANSNTDHIVIRFIFGSKNDFSFIYVPEFGPRLVP